MKNIYLLKILIVALGISFPSALSAAYTAVVDGSWSDPTTWGGIAPPASVTNEDITIPYDRTVNMDVDVIFTSTTGINTLLVEGTLSNTFGKGLTMVSGNLAGTDGHIAIKWVRFRQLASSSFTGLMNVGTFCNESNLSVTHTLNVMDTLDLKNGALILNNNGHLTLQNYSTFKIDNGALTLSGGVLTKIYPYNVMYIGSSKTTGLEMTGNTINDVYINLDNSQTVTLNVDSITVHGDLVMTTGNFVLNGKRLKLYGGLSQTPVSRFRGDANADLILKLTSVTADTLYFETGATANHSINKLVMNTSGLGTLVLGSDLIIENELNFTNGKLALANGDLSIMPAASVTGYSDTKYIVTSEAAQGSLVMNVVPGSPYMTFPIGTSSGYCPAHIQQNALGTAGNFSIRSMNTVLTNGTSGTVYSDLKLVDRTWFITSTSTVLNANVKLGWDAASELNGFDRANAYISRYTSPAWDVTPSEASVAGSNNTYELTRNNITSLGPLAVYQESDPVKLNEVSNTTNSNVDLYPNPVKDVVNIKMPGASADYKYELVDLTGRIIAIDNNKNSSKFNTSDLQTGCYFVKVTNLTDNNIVTKRFIKE